ncbi:MAG: anti-sigma factor antagonist [Alphaproteobacteria bacterium]|nr:anti-sigma factor antagonist [Alphaproteobacteria bacterium]
MDVIDLGDNTLKIVLHGRLDTPGVDKIETRFSATIVPGGRHAIVDLSDVSFIASMGLRMFISVARSVNNKHGKLVLLSPQEMVHEVFKNAALGQIIPIVFNEEDARAAVA